MQPHSRAVHQPRSHRDAERLYDSRGQICLFKLVSYANLYFKYIYMYILALNFQAQQVLREGERSAVCVGNWGWGRGMASSPASVGLSAQGT